uniref:Uncharacterized protein n=1 Tax=viral metagenome TaxID=1070528 RepID=A0A6C0D937_9ZZZZ
MTTLNFTNIDCFNRMKQINELIGISDDFSIEKNKNVIFVYTPPKVGSTTLVSSIRLNACGKFTVLHIHNEIMLKILYNINDVKVIDIIYFNKYLGKNVKVIDIYRSPIEQKISTFFENIHSLHFNVPIENLNTFQVERLIKRFNQVFPYLKTNDHFRNNYNINVPEKFDYVNKYIHVNVKGIDFYKIRLIDSNEWNYILTKILDLNINIYIIKDYETDKKPLKDIFSIFKEKYRIPINLFETIENDENLNYYYSNYEKNRYLNMWRLKLNNQLVTTFTPEEYVFYMDIALDNQYMSEIQMEHYIDLGCLCNACCRKRARMLIRLKNGENVDEKINHIEAKMEYIQLKAKHMPVYIKKRQKSTFGNFNFRG